jgi:DnaJ-class molecular chaperone
MLRYHPDRNDSADAPEMTRQLNQAYEVLSDPAKRAAYDKEIATERRTNPGSRSTATGSQSSPNSESQFRLKNFLPSRAWLTGLVVAFVIATFMLFVGSN